MIHRPALYLAAGVVGIGLLVAGVRADTVFWLTLVALMIVMHMGGHGHGGHGGGSQHEDRRRPDPEGGVSEAADLGVGPADVGQARGGPGAGPADASSDSATLTRGHHPHSQRR